MHKVMTHDITFDQDAKDHHVLEFKRYTAWGMGRYR